MVAMFQTFVTHPGEVTQQLIDRLKSQLVHPKQIDRMAELSGLKRKEYLLKCFNRAMMRHI